MPYRWRLFSCGFHSTVKCIFSTVPYHHEPSRHLFQVEQAIISPGCPICVGSHLELTWIRYHMVSIDVSVNSVTVLWVQSQHPVFRIRIHLIRIRIRIQHFRLNTDPDRDPIRSPGFDDKKSGKIYSWKKRKILFGSKTTIYLSLGLYKGRPSFRRSLLLSKENIQSSSSKHEIS